MIFIALIDLHETKSFFNFINIHYYAFPFQIKVLS